MSHYGIHDQTSVISLDNIVPKNRSALENYSLVYSTLRLMSPMRKSAWTRRLPRATRLRSALTGGQGMSSGFDDMAWYGRHPIVTANSLGSPKFDTSEIQGVLVS